MLLQLMLLLLLMSPFLPRHNSLVQIIHCTEQTLATTQHSISREDNRLHYLAPRQGDMQEKKPITSFSSDDHIFQALASWKQLKAINYTAQQRHLSKWSKLVARVQSSNM